MVHSAQFVYLSLASARNSSRAERVKSQQDEFAHTRTPTTSDQQPRPQDSTPKQCRRIMRRTRAQGPEARNRNEESGERPKKRKKFQREL